MRIVIDLQSCQTPGSRERGIGRYSLSLAKAMAEKNENHEFWLALNSRFPETVGSIQEEFSLFIPQTQILVYDVPLLIGELDQSTIWRRRASERIREWAILELRPDIVHVSSLFEGLGDNAVSSVGHIQTTSTAVTLYDLIPLIRPEQYLDNQSVRSWYHSKVDALKKANLLLAISESSRREAETMLQLSKEQISVVYPAADEKFKPVKLSAGEIEELYTRYGLKRPFVMYTGGIDFRKNISGLIKAYSSLPLDVRHSHQLAIVCSIKEYEKQELLQTVRQSRLADDEVIFTGFVSDSDLIALYNLCKLFVFPSLHEGFGLPALEAMSCGAAVIGSNASSLPEVIGRKDALFDPADITSISRLVYQGLTDDSFRSSLKRSAVTQAVNFSWKKSANFAIEAFEALYEKQQLNSNSYSFRSNLSTVRKRLAFVSPFPPQPSGIASYSVELISALQRYYDITLIVDQPQVELDATDICQLPVQNIQWFRKNFRYFERYLYQFGNSAFHKHMLELSMDYPGTVVLHDFYLSGLVRWMDVFIGPSGIFLKSLYDSHGYVAALTLARDGNEAASYKYPCNRSVIARASGVIFHSKLSQKLVAQWYGEKNDLDYEVIPQIYAPQVSEKSCDRAEARKKLGFSPTDIVVCSFGMLAPTKLSHRLLDAWEKSALVNDTKCCLIFVGDNFQGEYGEKISGRIQAFEPNSRVQLTGFVDSEKYHLYLASADIAVQLRSLSRGETSRAVLEAMFHSIPLIINAHGTLADYPENIAVKLPNDFTDSQLAKALELLSSDSNLRKKLGEKGKQYISKNHNPEQIAQLYYQAIERFSNDSKYSRYENLLETFKAIDNQVIPQSSDFKSISKSISKNKSEIKNPQILIDVSNYIHGASSSFYKEIVESTVVEWIETFSGEFRLEPIYFDGELFRYAREYTLRLLKIDLSGLEDDVVEISKQDKYVGLGSLPSVSQRSFMELRHWRGLGVKVSVLIFDEIPKGNVPVNDIRNSGIEHQLTYHQVLTKIANNLLFPSSIEIENFRQFIEASNIKSSLPKTDYFRYSSLSSKRWIEMASVLPLE